MTKLNLELVKRNIVEIINEEKLNEDNDFVVYCGYEPSGDVHLGHFVTITKLIDLQKAGMNVKVLFADWHAWLNRKGDWDFINETVNKWKKVFKATGLNAEFVIGSSFQMQKDYFEDVLKLSREITVKRGLRSMQQIGRDLENARISQLVYPIMQVVDMKYLNVNVALGGIEQRKVHMLAQEYLKKIDYDVPVFIHTPLISSLTGTGKMSSSKSESMISLTDDYNAIVKKLKKSYCPEGIVENNPILDIIRLIIFPLKGKFHLERKPEYGGNKEFTSYEDLEKDFAEKQIHPLDLKFSLAKELDELLTEIREKVI